MGNEGGGTYVVVLEPLLLDSLLGNDVPRPKEHACCHALGHHRLALKECTANSSNRSQISRAQKDAGKLRAGSLVCLEPRRHLFVS